MKLNLSTEEFSKTNSEQKKKYIWWLYVLKLESDKWYVGITSKTPEKRFQQHKNGFLAAAWTKHYKPIKIHYKKYLGECDISDAQLYEGRVTRKYMEHYGDNNVRGGDLTYDKEYVRRFGWIWLKDEWDLITYVVLLNLIIVWFVMDKYDWNIGIFILSVLVMVVTALVLRRFDKQN